VVLQSIVFLLALSVSAVAQTTAAPDEKLISPSRPVASGKAPGMRAKLVKVTPEEKVYAVVFQRGDEAVSGLTDFAIANHIGDAHLTAIGALSGATLGWFDPAKKMYHRIPVTEQVEMVSLIGDIATFNGKPVLHMHAALARQGGSMVGGHVFELNVSPTLEVFLTANTAPLKKKADDATGLKLIDPTQ
jgi:uncharacterized protein